jgi:heterotetrameric sarcosine oxidase alpha subunit
MSAQPFRNGAGGAVDRTKPLRFRFDGREYIGYEGDTLASALLANGVRLLGRSFKYHRPRGLFGAGFEDPNALVQLRSGNRTEPNIQASRVELYDGLVAESQNRWPSLDFDLGALTGVFSRLFPAGFYYKTFMWPASLWMTYEHVIRNIAGMGKSPVEPDPDRYAHRYQHCDVLVAGGGPAGIMAARAAAESGARVVLIEDAPRLGGALLSSQQRIDGMAGADWAARQETALRGMANVRVLTRTQAAGYYDHNTVIANERVADHLAEPAPYQPRQRIWHFRAREIVLAAGAMERPLVFAGNDLPNVMLVSAARTLAVRHGVRAGNRAVVFTNNASAYPAAAEMAAAGIRIAAIVDARAHIPDDERAIADKANIDVLPGHVVVAAEGGKHGVSRCVIARTPDSPATESVTGTRVIACDLLAVSGGWTPSVHLFSQSRGKLKFDAEKSCFVPNTGFQRERSAGACKGDFTLSACLEGGAGAGLDACKAAGLTPATMPVPACDPEPDVYPLALWALPWPDGNHDKRFVDLQNDVTAEDVALAHREGFRSVEHLKRYTTLGMGTDQGRTSNVNGLALMAGHRGEDIPAVGTTTFRQPFSPITMGAVAGDAIDEQMSPLRRTAMHDWHEKAGAPFVPAGAWLRAQAYPGPGESLRDAYLREAAHVRRHVGIVDVSTLGKIDVQGRDAAEFLNRLYINGFTKLDVGKCRYGVMLRDDGIAYDDGTVTRIADNRYLVTTTTVHAGPVLNHMERHAQIVWPELDVKLTSVTEDWAAIAIAGPHSRDVLARVIDGIELSNDACPFMAYREGTLGGVPVRLFRISFSGELAYEINVPADYGLAAWEALLDAGKDLHISPYGTEAMGILRIEKGHVVGSEINGRATADDLGFGRMLSAKKRYIGDVLKDRPALTEPGRKQLVGIRPVDGRSRIPRAAQIVRDPDAARPVIMEGEVTSVCESPNVGMPIGLALVKDGRARIGEKLIAASPVMATNVAVEICDPVFIDPAGERLHG